MSRTTRPPAEVPRLRPGLPVVRRGAATWQIGIDPEHAVLLHGVEPWVARALSPDGLPRTLPRRLVDALRAHGVLYDPPRRAASAGRQVRVRERRSGDSASAALHGRPDPLPRRLRGRVAVEGAGPVAALIATGLAHAGVRTVAVLGPARPVTPTDVVPGGPTVRDVGRPWAQAVADGVRALGATTTLVEQHRPHLVVLTQTVDADAPWCDPVHADRWLRSGVAHLRAAAAGRSGEVGAVVVPGRTPCLRCRELARADADPGWALVAAALRDRDASGSAVLAAALALTTASLAVARALAFLDHGEPPGQAQQSTAEPDLVVRAGGTAVEERSCAAHPACGCTWALGPVTMEA